jgi:hypothetical protein
VRALADPKEATVGDKSPKKQTSKKTAGKTLKEKRAAKHAKKDQAARKPLSS